MYAHIERSFWADMLGVQNQINTPAVTQLLTFTAPDTTNLFYISSLLTYEDWGLNFSPAIKELMQKTFAYSTYQHNF
jgi:hypothetical protein